MDPRISWIQPQQLGQATALWMTFWQTIQGRKNTLEPSVYNSTFATRQSFNGRTMPTSQPDFIPVGDDPVLNARDSSVPHGGKKRRENPALIYDANYSKETRQHGGVPWMKEIYPNDVIGLHEEIQHFYEYMRPSEEEQRMREYVVKQIEQVVCDLWEHARVEVFGSFKTGLYLPTSDIDLVVFGDWEELPLWTLRRRLIKRGIAEENSIKVLDRAAVPIVKIRHPETDVKVDISFNMEAGVRSVALIKEFIAKFPPLPKLVFVLKQFLLQRELNEVWTGGISSYSLVLLCVSFLQMHPRDHYRSPNLGVLLIEFFELYGRHFNFGRLGIRVKDGGSYIRRDLPRKQTDNGFLPLVLSIEDPLTPGNDLGKGSYGMLQVKQAFEYAYKNLENVIQGRTNRRLRSLLGEIVKVTDEVIEYRRDIRGRWARPRRRNVPQVPSPSSISSGRSDGSDEVLASAELSNESTPPSTPIDSEADTQRQSSELNGNERQSPMLEKKKPPSIETPEEKQKQNQEIVFKGKGFDASTSSSRSEPEKKRGNRNLIKSRKLLKRDFESSKKKTDVSVNSSKS